MLPLLPIELIENVINEAKESTQTLRNFALTCRDLLPRSRYHLFYFIRFRDVTQLHSFYKFLKLYPHVGSFVISLTLSTTQGDPRPLSLLQIIPMPLFCKLPHLCMWEITDPDANLREPRQWLSFPSPTLACLREHGTAIVKLYLDSISLPNCAYFVQYIQAFRGLEYLYCRSLHFKTGLDDLRFLGVKQRLAGRLRLSTLIIDDGVPDDASLALLESSPSTLLDLEFYVQETELDIPSLVSEMHKLRSLTLALQLSGSDDDGDEFVYEGATLRIFKIIKAISLRSESRLQNLIIHLLKLKFDLFHRMLFKKEQFPALECFSELEIILLRLSSLRNIEVHHDIPRDIDGTGILEQYLPTLASQKTVTFKRLTPNHRQQASHDSSVWSLAVSPNSEQIASGSADCTVILWDAHSRSIVHEWIAHSDGVTSLAFSPDSRHLASTSFDRTVVVWDISGSGAKRVATLEGHSDDVYTCAWSPDGTLLVSGSQDGTVRIWDTRTYEQIHSLQDPSVKEVDFVRFSPDGRWIASGGWITSDCAVWDAATGDLHVVLRGHREDLRNVVFDVATGRIATASQDRTVRVWDVEMGEALVVLEGHTNWVRDVAFSPDGRRVVSGSDDRTVKVWDSFSGDLLLSLEGHTYNVWVVCFSPDGKYIASGSLDETVRLWRASDGACTRTFTEHTDDVWYLVYSPDGETLTSGGLDGNVCIRRVCDIMLEEDSGADGPVQSK